MDLFDYLRSGKLNVFEETFSEVAPAGQFPGGPTPWAGLLGMRKKIDDKTALAFSNTTIGTCRNGIYQLFRSDPAYATPADWVRGRLLFAKTLGCGDYVLTPLAATTAQPVGVAIDSLTTSGTVKIVQVFGDAVIKWLAGAATKAVPAIMDPVVFAVAANLAVADVELDATAHANAIVKRLVGRVIEVPANPAVGAVLRILLDKMPQVYNRGVM